MKLSSLELLESVLCVSEKVTEDIILTLTCIQFKMFYMFFPMFVFGNPWDT